ncbi:hypothetical protein FE257_005712 [Aspergillus nanangensis]|uniref:Uncharacterized protein n=1 Tax=Aspergillus nanangensis TaxID=2582783 RepID=A0AAD4CQ26_ASPNN|nr:hypothetical protein FE257_005712 [Aspergillus nanangensis]
MHYQRNILSIRSLYLRLRPVTWGLVRDASNRCIATAWQWKPGAGGLHRYWTEALSGDGTDAEWGEN